MRPVLPLRVVLMSLVLLSLARRARADGPDYKKMKFAERAGQLVVTASFTELFDQKAYEALSSGFPTRVVVKIYMYRKKQELPVSVQVLIMQVVYDLWDEVYLLRIDGPDGRRHRRLDSRIEVLQTMSRLQQHPLADLDSVAIGPHYFLALVAELNPVDEKRLAEMRRWLTKENSQSNLDSSSSFFGSFVSVFVNTKLQKADRILRLRSQPFYRVKR